ncbi:hypothetical protein OIU76_005855 [Salix suchowensis]|nr:hypothetical protein OIU76_005855 [Salix suchowensis]
MSETGRLAVPITLSPEPVLHFTSRLIKRVWNGISRVSFSFHEGLLPPSKSALVDPELRGSALTTT